MWSRFLVNAELKQAVCRLCFRLYRTAKNSKLGVGFGMHNHFFKGCGIGINNKTRKRMSVGGDPSDPSYSSGAMVPHEFSDLELSAMEEMLQEMEKEEEEQPKPPPAMSR